MKCSIKCPFFMIKERVGFVNLYCRLEQDSIFERDWKPMIIEKDQKCHMIKERILEMDFIAGVLDVM